MLLTVISPLPGRIRIVITDITSKMPDRLSHYVVAGHPVRIEYFKPGFKASGVLIHHARIDSYQATGKILRIADEERKTCQINRMDEVTKTMIL